MAGKVEPGVGAQYSGGIGSPMDSAARTAFADLRRNVAQADEWRAAGAGVGRAGSGRVASLEKLGRKDEAAAKFEEARRAEARLAVPVKLD